MILKTVLSQIAPSILRTGEYKKTKKVGNQTFYFFLSNSYFVVVAEPPNLMSSQGYLSSTRH
jgi:hypothetical protein